MLHTGSQGSGHKCVHRTLAASGAALGLVGGGEQVTGAGNESPPVLLCMSRGLLALHQSMSLAPFFLDDSWCVQEASCM